MEKKKRNFEMNKGEKNFDQSLHSIFEKRVNKEPTVKKMTSGNHSEKDDTLLFGRSDQDETPTPKKQNEKKPFGELDFDSFDQWNTQDTEELKSENKSKNITTNQGNELFFTQAAAPLNKQPFQKMEQKSAQKQVPSFSAGPPKWDQPSTSKAGQSGPPSTGLGSPKPTPPAEKPKFNAPSSNPVPPSKPVPPTKRKPVAPPAKTGATKKVSIFSRQSKYFMMICMIAGLLITGIGVAYTIQTFGLSNTGKFFGDLVRVQAGEETVKLVLREVGYDGENPTTVDKEKFLKWVETSIKPKVEKPVKNARLKGNKLSAGIEKEQVGYQVDMTKVNAWLNDIPGLVKDTKEIPLVTLVPEWTEEDYQKVNQKSIGSAKRKLKNGEDFTKHTQSLDGWVVDPRKTFSLHEALQASGLKTNGTRSLALVLSSAASQADLDDSIEKSTDFQFMNNYNKPVLLKMSVESDSIVVEVLTTPESQPSSKQTNND